MLGINRVELTHKFTRVWSKYVWKPQFCLNLIWTLALFLVCRYLNFNQFHSMMGISPRSPRLVMEPEKSPVKSLSIALD